MTVSIFLLVAIAYVAYCIYRVIPLATGWKIAAVAIMILAFACFFISFTGRLEQMPMEWAARTYVIGNSCMICFLYLLMMFLLLRALQFCHILPAGMHEDSWAGTALVFGSTALLLIYGGIHYKHKYREEIDIASGKVTSPVKVVLMSDLHVGYHNRRAELARWIDIVNSEHPDIVLVAGDIIDRSIRALYEDGDAEEFRRIEAPVYACLGNHEHYAGDAKSELFYLDAGIKVLKDASAEVCGIEIIGRDDYHNKERAPLPSLVEDIDRSKFILLLDHQPENLDEAMESDIDFQFSGHTHNGQIFPGNIILRFRFEHSYGEFVKGNTRYYITSGLGIWGGKFRIGTRSEYVVLNLKPE